MSRRTSRPRIIAPQPAPDRTLAAQSHVRTNDVDSIDIAELTIQEGSFGGTVSEARLKQLGEALRTLGYPTALPVRNTGAHGGTPRYVLIGGHRVYRAAELLLAKGAELTPGELQRIRQVPIVIDRGMNTPSTMAMLLTSTDRVTLPPLDVARAFSDLKKRSGYSNLHIGIAFGASEGKVYGYTRVVADPELVKAVESGMRISVAMALAQVQDPVARSAFIASAREGKCLTMADVTGKKTSSISSIFDDVLLPALAAHPDRPDPPASLASARAEHFMSVTKIFIQDLNNDDDREWERLLQGRALIDAALAGRRARNGGD